MILIYVLLFLFLKGSGFVFGKVQFLSKTDWTGDGSSISGVVAQTFEFLADSSELDVLGGSVGFELTDLLTLDNLEVNGSSQLEYSPVTTRFLREVVGLMPERIEVVSFDVCDEMTDILAFEDSLRLRLERFQILQSTLQELNETSEISISRRRSMLQQQQQSTENTRITNCTIAKLNCPCSTSIKCVTNATTDTTSDQILESETVANCYFNDNETIYFCVSKAIDIINEPCPSSTDFDACLKCPLNEYCLRNATGEFECLGIDKVGEYFINTGSTADAGPGSLRNSEACGDQLSLIAKTERIEDEIGSLLQGLPDILNDFLSVTLEISKIEQNLKSTANDLLQSTKDQAGQVEFSFTNLNDTINQGLQEFGVLTTEFEVTAAQYQKTIEENSNEFEESILTSLGLLGGIFTTIESPEMDTLQLLLNNLLIASQLQNQRVQGLYIDYESLFSAMRGLLLNIEDWRSGKTAMRRAVVLYSTLRNVMRYEKEMRPFDASGFVAPRFEEDTQMQQTNGPSNRYTYRSTYMLRFSTEGTEDEPLLQAYLAEVSASEATSARLAYDDWLLDNYQGTTGSPVNWLEIQTFEFSCEYIALYKLMLQWMTQEDMLSMIGNGCTVTVRRQRCEESRYGEILPIKSKFSAFPSWDYQKNSLSADDISCTGSERMPDWVLGDQEAGLYASETITTDRRGAYNFSKTLLRAPAVEYIATNKFRLLNILQDICKYTGGNGVSGGRSLEVLFNSNLLTLETTYEKEAKQALIRFGGWKRLGNFASCSSDGLKIQVQKAQSKTLTPISAFLEELSVAMQQLQSRVTEDTEVDIFGTLPNSVTSEIIPGRPRRDSSVDPTKATCRRPSSVGSYDLENPQGLGAKLWDLVRNNTNDFNCEPYQENDATTKQPSVATETCTRYHAAFVSTYMVPITALRIDRSLGQAYQDVRLKIVSSDPRILDTTNQQDPQTEITLLEQTQRVFPTVAYELPETSFFAGYLDCWLGGVENGCRLQENGPAHVLDLPRGAISGHPLIDKRINSVDYTMFFYNDSEFLNDFSNTYPSELGILQPGQNPSVPLNLECTNGNGSPCFITSYQLQSKAQKTPADPARTWKQQSLKPEYDPQLQGPSLITAVRYLQEHPTDFGTHVCAGYEEVSTQSRQGAAAFTSTEGTNLLDEFETTPATATQGTPRGETCSLLDHYRLDQSELPLHSSASGGFNVFARYWTSRSIFRVLPSQQQTLVAINPRLCLSSLHVQVNTQGDIILQSPYPEDVTLQLKVTAYDLNDGGLDDTIAANLEAVSHTIELSSSRGAVSITEAFAPFFDSLTQQYRYFLFYGPGNFPEPNLESLRLRVELKEDLGISNKPFVCFDRQVLIPEIHDSSFYSREIEILNQNASQQLSDRQTTALNRAPYDGIDLRYLLVYSSTFYYQLEHARRSKQHEEEIAQTLLEAGQTSAVNQALYSNLTSQWNDYAAYTASITEGLISTLPEETSSQSNLPYQESIDIMTEAEIAMQKSFEQFENDVEALEANIDDVLRVNNLILNLTDQVEDKIYEFSVFSDELILLLQSLLGVGGNDGSLTQLLGNYITSDTEPVKGPRGTIRNPVIGSPKPGKFPWFKNDKCYLTFFGRKFPNEPTFPTNIPDWLCTVINFGIALLFIILFMVLLKILLLLIDLISKIAACACNCCTSLTKAISTIPGAFCGLLRAISLLLCIPCCICACQECRKSRKNKRNRRRGKYGSIPQEEED